ncbi:13099_t:CDS:10 [Entrophospora sp. SA101]|nr:13099_t:CDS:10 [Entrophospora sp. SA101]CAJ0923952.1 22100_t:CDS:10 [Entrophospora sp. SA101]
MSIMWADKYKPDTFQNLNYHEDISKRLKTLASSDDFPHLLVYGPSGAGKKTRIACTLRELFGDGVLRIKSDQQTVIPPSNKKFEVNIIASNYHIEISPSDVGIHDRIVIQQLIKDIAQTQQIDASARHKFKARIQDPKMTGYVATRYYRAPEIMLTWQKYDVAEMIMGKPLFPGKDYMKQFSIIRELFGTPSDDVIKTICNDATLEFVLSLPKREKVPLSQKFQNVDFEVLDLLEKMLVFDPKTRITAEQALADKYLDPYHDESDEHVADEAFDWSFNETDLPTDNWKIRIYQEILDNAVIAQPTYR